MTRYLLGELSESERAALEERYFADPHVFEEVLKSESRLVDGYVRGHLSAEDRQRFEETYLTHPKRRERVKFAEALVTRIDQNQPAEALAEKSAGVVSGWRRLMAISGRRPILEFSFALATLLLVVGGVWFFMESRRSRQELAQAQSARAEQAARVRELEQQVAAERKRTEELNAELDRGRRSSEQQPDQVVATLPSTPRTLASLVLMVGSVRGAETGKTPTLVIPAGTTEAQLQLNLNENEYAGYQVSLQAAGGAEILSQRGLKPRAMKSGVRLTLVVPASKFDTGDYILTLRGVSKDGDIEDVSKSIFRVEKR